MNSIYSQIQSAIDLCRSIVLDSVEMELGGSPNWFDLRARILKAFGRKGLTRRLFEILGINQTSEGVQNG